MKYTDFIPAEKGCSCSADGGDYLLLDCIYNCSLRWSAIFHVVTLQIINKGFFLFQILPWSKILPIMHILCKKYVKNQSAIEMISIASAQIGRFEF